MLDSSRPVGMPTSSPNSATRTPLTLGFAALLSALVIYACFFSRLDALGLVGPDEPRYAAVAREMATTGDWVTPRLHGDPWLEKPVLYYWAAATALQALGVTETAARLPSALAALLATLLLAWLAWRRYDVATAWAVLFIFPTAAGVLGFARAATPDMLFSAALCLAMVAAARVLPGAGSSPGFTVPWQILLGAALAAAVLAKGPAALVLAGGSTLAWAALSGRWSKALRLLNPRSVFCFLLLALPWYVLCAQANPQFVRTFVIEHNVARFFTPLFRHEQPFWFYGPILLLGLVPWTVLLVGAAREVIARNSAWRDAPELFFACWALFPAVLFSFSRSKLPGYILPTVAPLVLLLARHTAAAIGQREPLGRWLLAGVGGTLVALAASGQHWLSRLPAESGLNSAAAVRGWLAGIAVAGGLAALLAMRKREWLAVALVAVTVAAQVEAVSRRLAPQLDPHLSARAAAAARANQPEAGEAAAYRLHRAWRYGLNFYLGQELPEWNPQTSQPAWLYTSAEGRAELERQGRVEAVLYEGSRAAQLLRVRPAATAPD